MSSQNQSFRQIYENHIGLLQFYLRKLNVSDDRMDDLTQEVFLRFYNNRHKVEAAKIKVI